MPLHIKQGSSLSVFKLASDTVGDVDFIYFILSLVFFKICAAFVQALCIALWSIVDLLYKQSWYDIAVSKKTNNEYIH